MCKEPLHQEGGNIQEKVVMMMIIEGHIGIGDPLREGDIQIKVEHPMTGEDTLIEDLLEEDTPIEIEDPLTEEDTQEDDPLMEMEDLLMKMEDPLDLLVDKDHQVLKDPLDQ